MFTLSGLGLFFSTYLPYLQTLIGIVVALGLASFEATLYRIPMETVEIEQKTRVVSLVFSNIGLSADIGCVINAILPFIFKDMKLGVFLGQQVVPFYFVIAVSCLFMLVSLVRLAVLNTAKDRVILHNTDDVHLSAANKDTYID